MSLEVVRQMMRYSPRTAADISASVGTEPVASIRSAMNRRVCLLDLQPTIDHAMRVPAGSMASTVQGLRNRTRPTTPTTASTTMITSSPSAIKRGIPMNIKKRTSATMTKKTTMPSAMSGRHPGSAKSPRSVVRRRTFRVRSRKRAQIVCWPRCRGAHRRRTIQIPAGVATFTSRSSRIGGARFYPRRPAPFEPDQPMEVRCTKVVTFCARSHDCVGHSHRAIGASAAAFGDGGPACGPQRSNALITHVRLATGDPYAVLRDQTQQTRRPPRSADLVAVRNSDLRRTRAPNNERRTMGRQLTPPRPNGAYAPCEHAHRVRPAPAA